MNGFASFLCNEDRDVFQNVHRIKRLLKLADSRFRDGNDLIESFFNHCTHGIKGDCWAFSCHHRFNTVLIPHGIEMIAIHENAFALQTLENAEDILTSPHDLFSMCVCLWLLTTHRCISKVVINVATVARFHAPLFWRLFSLNVPHLEKVELVGLPADESHFSVAQSLENATKLSEIIIAHIALGDSQVELLCDVLAQNEGLKRLVLKYVSMTAVALQVLSGAITKHSRPASLELREKVRTCEIFKNAVANLLDTPLSKLCLEAPCNWEELFKRLRCNTCLSELEIFDCGSRMYTSLKDLADALLENSTLKRLKVCIGFPHMDECAADQWRKLTESIGRNRGMRSLSLASWNYCEEHGEIMAELAEAIAQNKTLVELSVEECDLPVESLLLLFGGLSLNETMKALHIGTLLADEEVNRLVLKRVAELGLGERVDCTYVLKSDWQLDQSEEAYRATCFRRLRLVDTSALDGPYTINILRRAGDTLTSLTLEGVAGTPMSCTGAECLADMFANSSILEHVTLLFDVDASVAITILKGLASSRTIYTVIIGREWQLSREVAIAFGETLRKNSSIAELTVWQDTRRGFEELKEHLRLGVKPNYAISKVRLLYGPEKKESYDWDLLQMLQNNRVVASWAVDAVLGYNCTRACMYAFIRMKACNNYRAVLRRTMGCDKKELEPKIMEACKRSERVLPEFPLGGTEDGQTGASVKRTNALRTFNKDFIEEVKIFLVALNLKDKLCYDRKT